MSSQPQHQMHQVSVAIAGAGLSGLCLAQALLQLGFDVHVYERDSSLQARRQGYRVTLDEHGADALKRCLPPHLFELVLATASTPEEMGYFRFTNRQLGEIFRLTFRSDSQAGQDARAYMPGQVDRATLRTILLSGLEGRVHYGKAARRVESDATGAILQFADGDARQATFAIGADGLHSALRDQLLPTCTPLDTGYRAIYGKSPLYHDGTSFVPAALERSGVFAIGAPGHGFFFTSMRFNEPPQSAFIRLAPDQVPPIEEDYVTWAVLLPKEALSSDLETGDPQALHAQARTEVRDYHPMLRRLVDGAEVEYTLATTLNAAPRPKVWSPARATLMGDAVHVMPPLGAHGGNTALRDAALLADSLKDVANRGMSWEEAIGTYQAEMITYAFKEVERATAMLHRSTTHNPLMRFALLHAVPWARSLAGRSINLTGDIPLSPSGLQ